MGRLKIDYYYNVTLKWLIATGFPVFGAAMVYGQDIRIYSAYGNIEGGLKTYSNDFVMLQDGRSIKYFRMDSVEVVKGSNETLVQQLTAKGVKVILGRLAPVSGYYNFYRENEKVFWQRVFAERDFSFARVEALMNEERALKLVSRDSTAAILDLTDYVYDRSGYSLSARVRIEWKQQAYRVMVKDISYKPGANAKTTAVIFLGSNPDYQFYANSSFVKKSGEWSKTNNNPMVMDAAFEKLFAMKAVKSDW